MSKESNEINLWRDLSPEEEKEYRQWARDNYRPASEIKGVWHPVVRDECKKMNNELYEFDPNGDKLSSIYSKRD